MKDKDWPAKGMDKLHALFFFRREEGFSAALGEIWWQAVGRRCLAMMYLTNEVADRLKEKLMAATEPKDIVAVWSEVGLDLSEDDATAFIESCHFKPNDLFRILTRFSKQEREWISVMNQSTDVKELMDLSEKLRMPLTQEEAEIVVKERQRAAEKRPITEEERRLRPSLDDFIAATDRLEKEMILQKIYAWTLTPEELAMFFPPDD